MSTTRTMANPIWLESAARTVMAIERRLVKSTATWKPGEFLRAKADGLVYEGATNDGESDTPFQYMAVQALDSAIGADTTYLEMARINELDVFELNCYSGSAATAVITEAEVGECYGMYVASNVCSLNIDDAGSSGSKATTAFTVVKPTFRDSPFQDVSTDQYARVCVNVQNCEALVK